jgi:hypothetical protein
MLFSQAQRQRETGSAAADDQHITGNSGVVFMIFV